VRCSDPIPTPRDVVLAPPSCNLCPMQEMQELQTSPSNHAHA
jgi:hypothetical protein